MTYGSACAGLGCLQSNSGVVTTDDNGQAVVSVGPGQTIEYRRDGIALGQAPVGVASGALLAVGSAATVTLPHLLLGSAPAVDPVESDLVARLNQARAAQGLPLDQLNSRLSASADLQAAYLYQSGISYIQPDLFHIGPFQTTMEFRHGEVSLPDPGSGAEVVEGGGTVDETISDWMASPPHREVIFAPGAQLIGVGRVGAFTVVDTHPLCAGCDEDGPGARLGTAPTGPTAPAPAPPPPAATTSGSSVVDGPVPARPVPSCGREQLATQRLRATRDKLVRLKIGMHCLREGAGYLLIVRQGETGRILSTRRITRARTVTLSLRPARTATQLRVKLERDSRVTVAARTISLRA